MHVHPFEIQPAQGGRFGWFVDRNQDNPIGALYWSTTATSGGSSIPAGEYTWYQHAFEYIHNPSARVTGTHSRPRSASYYDGNFHSFEINSDYRISSRMTASLGWTRQDIELPGGAFVTNLVPIKGKLCVHDPRQPVGVASVQRPDGAVLLERSSRVAQSQWHGIVRGLQRSPRHDNVHAGGDAGTVVRGEVHATLRFLDPVFT